MIHPVDQTPQNVWDKAANAVEKDKSSMIRFILRGGRVPVQPNAVHRLADFFLTGFRVLDPCALIDHLWGTSPVHPPHIYDAICNGGGFISLYGMWWCIKIC